MLSGRRRGAAAQFRRPAPPPQSRVSPAAIRPPLCGGLLGPVPAPPARPAAGGALPSRHVVPWGEKRFFPRFRDPWLGPSACPPLLPGGFRLLSAAAPGPLPRRPRAKGPRGKISSSLSGAAASSEHSPPPEQQPDRAGLLPHTAKNMIKRRFAQEIWARLRAKSWANAGPALPARPRAFAGD